MRIVFLGTPAFALPSLEALRAAGHDVTLVVTQPDRPAGRGQKTTPSPVAAYARVHQLPLWQTSSVRGVEAEERLRQAKPEAMALAAFAALVPDNVLRLTDSGILNVHPSLLPRWRGAAPIQAALLAGDAQTGVSIIRLVKELDAGPVLLQETMPIGVEDDYLTLDPRLAELGARLLVQAFAEEPAGFEQDGSLATFAPRIERGDGRIDWAKPAEVIWRQVRAYRGWPQAFTSFGGRQLKILAATPLRDSSFAAPGTASVEDGVPNVQTGLGRLRLDLVQLEGKRAVTGAEFLRGYPQVKGAAMA